MFSGNPNGVLVAEVSGLPPGRALDAGAGAGADAIWPARHGWRVTGMEISRVALTRAAKAAAAAVVEVEWTHADLLAAPPAAGAYDLVSAPYLPIAHRRDHAAVRGLLAAVAPGGTLLFVHHDPAEQPEDRQGPDIGAFYQPREVAALLGDGWTVAADETRPRTAAAPPGTHHTRDTVLRARRHYDEDRLPARPRRNAVIRRRASAAIPVGSRSKPCGDSG